MDCGMGVAHRATAMAGGSPDNDGVVPRESGLPRFVSGDADRYLEPGTGPAADHRAYFFGVMHLGYYTNADVLISLHNFLSRKKTGNLPPVARVRGPSYVEFPAGGSATVELDGSSSYDRDGQPGAVLDYRWSFVGATPGAPTASVVSPQSVRDSTTLAAAGTYRFALAVLDGRGGLDFTEQVVTARQQGSTDPWRELEVSLSGEAAFASWTTAVAEQQLRWTADPTRPLADWFKVKAKTDYPADYLFNLPPDVPIYVQLVTAGLFGKDAVATVSAHGKATTAPAALALGTAPASQVVRFRSHRQGWQGPTSVRGLAATQTGPGAVRLAWTQGSDPASFDHYRVTTGTAQELLAGTGRVAAVLTSAGVSSVSLSNLSGAVRIEVATVDRDGTEARASTGVTVTGPPQIATASLPSAATGQLYSFALAGTGREPLRWSQDPSWRLPFFLTLSPAGVISGTPSADWAGTFSFVIVLTDGDGLVVSRRLQVTVVNGAAPNLVPEALAVTPTSAAVGTPLTVTFRVRNTGGASASASVARLRLTTSSTVKPTTQDPQPGSDLAVAALAAGVSRTYSVPVTVPASATVGARYLWLILDVHNAAGQGPANQADDWANVPFTVTAGGDAPAGMTYLRTNAQGYREYRNGKDGSVLIDVPAGSFRMGTTTAEAQDVSSRWGYYPSWEMPSHQVTLSRYFIGKYEVTNAQYRAFLAATSDPAGPTQHVGHHPSEGTNKNHTPYYAMDSSSYIQYSSGDTNPVIWIDWYDCYAYCAWAGLRMPTEAQWECSARGRDGRTYPWGNDLPEAGGVYRCNGYWTADGYQYTAPVGTFGTAATSPRADGTSPFGALDMSGNVWEWVADWYNSSYYGSQSTWNDPTGPLGPLSYRVIRGGGWSSYYYYYYYYLRAAARYDSDPTSRNHLFGFRVGASPQE
jgi:iron(II)-dependent oxidoreductase